MYVENKAFYKTGHKTFPLISRFQKHGLIYDTIFRITCISKFLVNVMLISMLQQLRFFGFFRKYLSTA